MIAETSVHAAGMTMSNKRQQSRRRMLKTGTVAFNDRHSTLPCAVRDLSDTGARLRVKSTLSAPDTFALLIDLDGSEADCAVVWRTATELGVRFLSPPRKLSPKRIQVVRPYVPPKTPSLRRPGR